MYNNIPKHVLYYSIIHLNLNNSRSDNITYYIHTCIPKFLTCKRVE